MGEKGGKKKYPLWLHATGIKKSLNGIYHFA
jgi:hypothetical protein